MRRGDLGWAAAYLLLAVLRLAPLSLDPAHRLADDGDAFVGAWIVWWGSTHLGLGYPGIFDANAFFPHADGLLYSEPMLAQAILGWPFFRLAEPVLAINLLTIATFALSAFGRWWALSSTERRQLRAAAAEAARARPPRRTPAL